MPKVVHLTSAHSATDIRVFRKECHSLAQAGMQVVLIAPHDADELLDGVQIRAIPKPRRRAERFTRTLLRIFRQAAVERADIYHFHDPDLLPVGAALRARGAAVVYDVHENYGQAIEDKYWIPRPLRWPLARGTEIIERISGRILDGFVAATPAIAAQFPAGRTVLVQNFPLRDEFAAAADGPPLCDRPLYVGYAGGITSSRCAVEMVEAIGLAAAAYGDPGGEAGMAGRSSRPRLRLAGPMSEPDLMQRLEQRPGWSAVDYLGHLDRLALGRMLGELRIGLVLFKPLGNHVNAQPNKLFEFMSAGLPIVCSDFPLWREIVEGHGCGICVDPESPTAIADAVGRLLSRPDEAEAMGRAGRQAVRRLYNWDAEFEKLRSFYGKLLQARSFGR